jgi:hypothetical protein
MRRRFALLIATLCILAGVRPSHAAWPHDTSVNLHVATTPYAQDQVKMASDGAGGFFLTWQQQSASTGLDVYAQHVTAAGGFAPGWPAGGIALYGGSSDQTSPVVLADGVGGAYFVWEDKRANGVQRDIYITRLAADGSIPSGWVSGGSPIQQDPKDEYTPVLVSDGSGGLFVIWTYLYGAGDTDIYGAHYLANGTKAWGALGLAAPLGLQSAPAVVQDGAGGLIFAYVDETSGLGKDVRAARFFGTGFQAFNVSVLSVSTDQYAPAAVSDGEGGAIIAYQDNSLGNSHVLASRITATGSLAPGWYSSGNPLCGFAAGQTVPTIVSDGSHGAIVSWLDFRVGLDLYATRINAFGAVSLGWTPDGTPISTTTPGGRGIPAMVADGVGGVVIAWGDTRNFGSSIYASRVTANGSLPLAWTYDGTPIRVVANLCSIPVIAADGGTGFGIAWTDYRLTPTQIYAQRVERFGVLGNPEPVITRVKDVAQDQGGEVRIDWSASWPDADPTYGVSAYWVWRQVPIASAQTAVARGATWVSPSSDAGTGRGLYMPALDGASSYAWEFVTSLEATGFPTYSYVASTTTDSMPAGNPRTAFLIQARGTFGGFWSSAPDSGYSVDNLSPAMPAPFTGVYGSGSTALHWGRNAESDLANYRLYRGSSPSFVPGIGNLVASPSDTGFVDAAGSPYFYKLSAVDVHGNESPFALVIPSGTTDVPDGAIPGAFALVPTPSPARGPMVMSFALPQSSEMTLAIFDAAGRRMLDLARGWRAAGSYHVPWDGRDQAGNSLPSGVYFARLQAPPRTITVRFVRMR